MLNKFIGRILFFLFSYEYISQNVTHLYNNTFQSNEGTYNILTYQTGFCKMQGYDTTNRKNSFGPSLFTSGKIQFGVGLSSIYFGDIPNQEGLLTCGMCLNVTNIKTMPKFSNDLTYFEPTSEIDTPFLVMVFDQCKDLICQQEGFLDIDIYGRIPNKNIQSIEWTGIECPTDENDTIELLFCTENTCNINDIYEENILFGELISENFFSIIPRNMRIPIQKIQVFKNDYWIDLVYVSAIGWTWPTLFNKNSDFHIRIISYKNDIIELTIPIENIKKTPISIAYRGGIIFDTYLNFV